MMDQVQLDQDDTFEIQTEVCDPVIKDGLQKYVMYTFKGTDKSGFFEVTRRYNDFDVFRASLIQRWPGCYIPPLPVKKPMGNMDQKFIEERRFYLDMFVKKVATLKHLWYSEECELFKKSAGDVEKLLANMPRLSTQDIVYKYEKQFKELSGKEINPELLTKIMGFQSHLRKIQPLLQSYQQTAKQFTQTRLANQENMILLIDYLMPEYEKNCLAEYVVNPEGRMVFEGKGRELVAQMKTAVERDALDDLYLNIKIENREIDSMLEVFQQKEKFDQYKQQLQIKLKDYQAEKRDIEAGKTTLKSLGASIGQLFNNNNKQEALQKLTVNIETTQKEIETATVLYDMIILIIGYIEIARFKMDKELKYFNMLRKLGKFQIEKSKIQLEYWQELLKSPMLQEM